MMDQLGAPKKRKGLGIYKPPGEHDVPPSVGGGDEDSSLPVDQISIMKKKNKMRNPSPLLNQDNQVGQ